MTARKTIHAKLEPPISSEDQLTTGRLPLFLRVDRSGARLGMMRRLATSRLFAIGDKAGVLRNAQKRSGRSFRLDVRQRVIVKCLVSRHVGEGALRRAGLVKHINYLGRSGAGLNGERAEFFDHSDSGVDAAPRAAAWSDDRHHFRFVISPEFGDRIADLRDYVREVMRRVGEDLGQPQVEWIGTCHFDTDQPHAHVIVRGRKANGRDLVIPRDYIGYGFRGRAQEVAHERLGDLSRTEAERRIWRETQADRFTGFDRRLLQAGDDHGMVDDGVGRSDAWAALMRGRLRRLEMLGLATRKGARYQLNGDLEKQLRSLQLRQDIIRTLHQRQLETGRTVHEVGGQSIKGRVVDRGAHDELGSTFWVIVRGHDGIETYARLRFGEALPRMGSSVVLTPSSRGTQIEYQRGADFGRG